MGPAIVALASATSWGSSDFLGGVAARRISPYQTVAVSHLLSLVAVLLILIGVHASASTHQTLVYGLVAGLFGGGGLMLFYGALSLGSMGLTAAFAGVLTAAVPVLFGLATQGLPKSSQLLGFALAIAAIWLIAAAPLHERPDPRTLWYGAISGLSFGIYFVALERAGHGAYGFSTVLWAMLYSRIASAALASLLCLVLLFRSRPGRSPGRWGAKTLAIAAAVGLLDTGGNVLYMTAARLSRIDIAAVLSSLYPAVTILLAAAVLHERTTRTQTFGMAMAVVAVALIAG